MYNVFPDLDKFNSWWNSGKSQYFKDIYTKTYYLSQASSDFRVNRGGEMSGMFIQLRKDASKWVLGYKPVGDMDLSFYDLRGEEGRFASPENLKKNQELTCGSPELTLIMVTIWEYDSKSTGYYCEVESGHILFDNFDRSTGVVTMRFDNVTLKETNPFGGTLDDEPRKNVINGTVSLIYYDDYE